ncbi:MAG: GNAT family N-acetyltransferase [Synechococcales bacterium]|nr:GNAT family N-acetyltransferase [Synechococcales bacterium]
MAAPADDFIRDYSIRRARPQDARAIARLTRELTATAMGQRWSLGFKPSKAIRFCIGLGLGLLICLALAQPHIVLRLIVTLSPLLILLICLSLLGWQISCPTWSDYWVVEWQAQIIACAKLYQTAESTELYDLFVHSNYRQQGIGRALVQHLMAHSHGPIYLASLPKALPFYEHLGFRRVDPHKLSPILQTRLSLINPRFSHLGLIAMVRDRSISVQGQFNRSTIDNTNDPSSDPSNHITTDPH